MPNKDTIIGELLSHTPSCQTIFEAYEMPCRDCPSAWGETVEEACSIHGVDMQKLLADLESHFEG